MDMTIFVSAVAAIALKLCYPTRIKRTTIHWLEQKTTNDGQAKEIGRIKENGQGSIRASAGSLARGCDRQKRSGQIRGRSPVKMRDPA